MNETFISFLIIIFGAIISLAIIIASAMYNNYLKTKSPQFNCNHEMDTIQTWNGNRSNEYLSTCKKCGYQNRHHFSGIN